MIAVILSWLLLFIVFFAFGDMTVLLWNKITKGQNIYSVIDKVWIGLGAIGIVLLYLSIFVPINMVCLIVVVLFSIIYLIYRGREVKMSCPRLKQEKTLFILLFIAILGFAVAMPDLYDIGLYHLQTMQWAESFKVVPGLGNLHGRLGFNSSFLLLSTLLNYQIKEYLLFFSINSFALLLLSWWILSQFIKSNTVFQKIVLLFTLASIVLLTGKTISSSSTDILPNLLIIYLLLSWMLNSEDTLQKTLLFAFIPAFCITLKLSSAPILLATLFYIVHLYKSNNKRNIRFILLVGLIIAVPWLLRFVILTGYLVYPLASIDFFSVDWKTPINMVEWEQNAAFAWAKIPNRPFEEVLKMSIAEWFPIWLKNLPLLQIGLYLLALLSPVLLIIAKAKSKLAVWSIAYAGFIFGFITAPDFRFTFGFILMAAIIPFLSIKNKTTRNIKISGYIHYLGVAILTGLVVLSARHLYFMQKNGSDNALSLIYKPQPIYMTEENRGAFEEYKIDQISILAPSKGNQCFDQAIPCTPYYNSNLELRGEGVEDGFRIKNN